MATVYKEKCLDCKYEWTSRQGKSTPEECPKCRSKRIEIKPIG